MGGYFPEGKRLKLEANHPPTPNAPIKEQFPYMPFKHPQGQFYLLGPADFGSGFLQELAPVTRLHKTYFIGK